MNQGRKKYFSVYSTLVLIGAGLFSGCTKDPGFFQKARPEVTIRSTDSRLQSNTIHFAKDTVYILATDLTREAGQLLSIEAGTLIKINDGLSITINPDAVIEAKGTATEPVVFTSAAYMGGAGKNPRFWNGIHIYGNYLTNGTSSGNLSHVRIEFAGGDQFNFLPSLLLSNLSKETTVENIQVSYSNYTSSFGFYGGNVNAGNLVSYASTGTDFYIREGYKGMLQNLLAWRHPYFPERIPSPSSPFNALAGVFIEGAETLPVISNATVIGPDLQKGTGYYYTNELSPTARVAALVTTGGSKFHICNSVFMGFPKVGWYMDDQSSAIALNNGESDLTYSIVHSNDPSTAFYLPGNVYHPYTSDDFKAFALQPKFGNQLFLNSAEFVFTDPFNYDNNPDALPQAGSPLLSGSNFDSPVFSDPFFKKVNYRGASGSDNWMQGWTNFDPLRTNYNN